MIALDEFATVVVVVHCVSPAEWSTTCSEASIQRGTRTRAPPGFIEAKRKFVAALIWISSSGQRSMLSVFGANLS